MVSEIDVDHQRHVVAKPLPVPCTSAPRRLFDGLR
jgi:hypothetical protein